MSGRAKGAAVRKSGSKKKKRQGGSNRSSGGGKRSKLVEIAERIQPPPNALTLPDFRDGSIFATVGDDECAISSESAGGYLNQQHLSIKLDRQGVMLKALHIKLEAIIVMLKAQGRHTLFNLKEHQSKLIVVVVVA